MFTTEKEALSALLSQAPDPNEVPENWTYTDYCHRKLSEFYSRCWYDVCGLIYATTEMIDDPLCGDLHPLVFGAQNHNPAFCEAYIRWQGDNLSFDGTILEEIVAADGVEVMKVCLQHGASANAFSSCGKRLVELSQSFEMRVLLRHHGAIPTTREEELLVYCVYQLRKGQFPKDALDELLSGTPRLRISWYNAATAASKLQTADLFFEAARLCNPSLIAKVYPYVRDSLSREDQKRILMTILGESDFFVFNEHDPEDIVATLEALCRVGYHYDSRCYSLFHSACNILSIQPPEPYIQRQIFHCLWKMCTNKAPVQSLCRLEQEFNLSGFKDFLYDITKEEE